MSDPDSGGDSTFSSRLAAGQVKEEWKNARGQLHRLDGPAAIDRTKAGVPFRLSYYRDGKRFRDDGGPAVVLLDHGIVREEKWYRGHGLHRIDGPAVINRRTGGEPKQSFHFHGTEHSGLDGVGRALSTLSEEEIRYEIATSSFAELVDGSDDPERIVAALAGGVTTFEGIREVVKGAPPEWVRAYEESLS